MTVSSSRSVATAGLLVGLGRGGFVDGILLHQILQWHNMLSSVMPPVDLVTVKANMVFDGLFHVGTWIATALGVALLWRAGLHGAPWSTRTFVGSTVGGWGTFNLVEGLIDHQVLGLHHVHPGRNQLAWDLGFLASGVLLLAAGWVISRRASDATVERSTPPTRAPSAAAHVPGLR